MKKNLLSLAAILAIGLAFVSCSSKDIFDEEKSVDLKQQVVKEEYKAAFVQKYGVISPFETWDFSHRGSTLADFARTRKNDKDKDNNGHGQSTNLVQNMSSTDSYGYLLNYSNNESKIAKLFNKHWGDIVAAINGVGTTTWAPSGKVIFSVVGVSRDEASSTKYFTWGIAGTPEGDLYLRQSSPANGKNAKIGNSAEQHTSSQDFSMIPSGARWFTASSDKKKVDLTSEYNQTISDYKVVTLNIEGVDYTFWGFKCDETNPDYTNLVLWVREVESVPVPVLAKRYMVEDLGGSFDFDFNDVVFDVIKFTDGSQKCYVRALGGTLDITINVGDGSWTKSDDYTVTDMLNTNPIDPMLCLKEFDASGWDGDNSKVSVTVGSKEGVTAGGNASYYWAVPFPAVGEAPLIVATLYGSKTWMLEQKGIPNKEWFVFSDTDLSDD